MTAKSEGNWTEYWNRDDFWINSPLWKLNAELFFRRLGKVTEFGEGDSVLDIGCGPGHLEMLLSPLVREILAADTAEQFVESCRRKCEGLDNVETVLLGSDYTDLTLLGRKFSLILCVSVVQYYRNMGEVEALISSAREVALPGARLLIADMPLRRGMPGFLWDALCSLSLGAREGYLPTLLRTALSRWAGSSDYQDFFDDNEQLLFSIRDIESLVERMGLKARIVRENLSIYANRPGLLVDLGRAEG